MGLFDRSVPKAAVQQIVSMARENSLRGKDLWGLIPYMWKNRSPEDLFDLKLNLQVMMNDLIADHRNLGAVFVRNQDVLLIDPNRLRELLERGTEIKDWNGLKQGLTSLGCEVIEKNDYDLIKK